MTDPQRWWAETFWIGIFALTLLLFPGPVETVLGKSAGELVIGGFALLWCLAAAVFSARRFQPRRLASTGKGH